ncbi:uncharacterized protein LOC129612340 [Condylostylus longicornis]|uniref:uncharacterized protein LOC129612340 n=1 Tax=Condylostylus longicornis TaxID=2530218 RepID=UPI00244E04F8|nr:uncharacterized protein LOC129612340 [Condylostylus longicornis]
MPTSEAEDEEIEATYGKIEEACKKVPNKKPLLIIGDFNAKVGKTYDEQLKDVVGAYGIGDRNERGERLLQFSIDNNFSVMNTMFKHHPRRLSTWTHPNQIYKNQIDYILIRKRWRTSVRNVKTRPGADCDTDHKLLVCNFMLKLHCINRPQQGQKLTITDRDGFMQKLISTSPDNIQETEGSNEYWNKFKKWIVSAAIESRTIQRQQKQHWISNTTLQLVDKRRELRHHGRTTSREEIKKLNKQIKKACSMDKNNHIAKVCADLERYSTQNDTKELFKTVKYLVKEFNPQKQIIKDENGKTFTDEKEVAEVWKQYCTKLFSTSVNDVSNLQFEQELEPQIIKSEVRSAINKLKSGKSAGIDGITAEILKVMEDHAIDHLLALCNIIWQTGVWPDD